jgi:hypothetical protein
VADIEEPLVGGRSTLGVVRIGDSVHRPAGPWTKTVQAFLAHIRANGFPTAPEPRGFDARGREVLSFIAGDVLATPQSPNDPLVLVPYPEPWRSDEALATAGKLIRSLHEASKGFTTTSTDWRLCDRSMRGDEIICHGDLGPWNTVYVAGRPAAFIDWDSARPDTPLLDLASAAWHFVPLADHEELTELGFGSIDYRARLDVFVDAYALRDRSELVAALQQAKQRETQNVHFWGLGASEAADYIGWVADQLRWLHERLDELGL